MPCPKGINAESHFQGEMRKRAMMDQSNGFIFFSFWRKQKLQFFCCAVTVVMVFNALGQKLLKIPLKVPLRVCQRATPTGQTGPPSSCPSTWSVIPGLSVWPVIWMFTSHSFLKLNLRWTDSNSFCRTNQLREILEIYIIALSATHQTFPTLTSGHGRIGWSIIFVIRHGHVTCFGHWNVSRNDVCYLQAQVWRTGEQFTQPPFRLPQLSAMFQVGSALWAEVLEWSQHEAEPPVHTQWTCVVWGRNKTVCLKTLRFGGCLHSITKPLWLTQFFTGVKISLELRGGWPREVCSIPTISPSPQAHSAWSWTVTPVSFVFCYPLRDTQHAFPNVHRRVSTSNDYRSRQVTWMSKQADAFISNVY